MAVLPPPPSVEINGALLAVETSDANVLVVNLPAVVKDDSIIARGKWRLLFGLMLLYEDDIVLPQLIVDDFGRQFSGEAGIEFMLREGDSFPRADVFGRRLSTGLQDQLFFKQVDLARSLQCIAEYRRRPKSIYRISAIVWLDESIPSIRPLERSDGRAEGLLWHFTRRYIAPSGALQSIGAELNNVFM